MAVMKQSGQKSTGSNAPRASETFFRLMTRLPTLISRALPIKTVNQPEDVSYPLLFIYFFPHSVRSFMSNYITRDAMCVVTVEGSWFVICAIVLCVQPDVFDTNTLISNLKMSYSVARAAIMVPVSMSRLLIMCVAFIPFIHFFFYVTFLGILSETPWSNSALLYTCFWWVPRVMFKL